MSTAMLGASEPMSHGHLFRSLIVAPRFLPEWLTKHERNYVTQTSPEVFALNRAGLLPDIRLMAARTGNFLEVEYPLFDDEEWLSIGWSGYPPVSEWPTAVDSDRKWVRQKAEDFVEVMIGPYANDMYKAAFSRHKRDREDLPSAFGLLTPMYNGSSIWWFDHGYPERPAQVLEFWKYKQGSDLGKRNGRHYYAMSYADFDSGNWPSEIEGIAPKGAWEGNTVHENPVDDQQIAHMYSEGMSIRDIASALNVSKNYVDQSLRTHGVGRRTKTEASLTPQALMRAGRTDPKTEQRIVELYSSGESAEVVAAAFGISSATVSKILARYGVAVRGTAWRKSSADVDQRAIELYRSGMTMEQVSRELGIATSHVISILKRSSVPRRRARLFGTGENPVDEYIAHESSDGGLICMGREFLAVLKNGREVKAKHLRDGMLFDSSGTYWPKCSLLIAPFENGTEASKQAGNYFGRDAEVFEGRVDLPPQSLDEWTELGEVKEVFYDRAGTKHPGFFRHEFHKPKGMYKVVFLIKGKAAKQPAVLYQHGECFRLELPGGCIVDDRGIVLP